MQRPSHHLDLCLVPADPNRKAPDRVDLFDRFAAAGFTNPDGSAGPACDALVQGGFARVRLDVPGAMALYSNGQGGFRVFCPRCATNLTAVWSGQPRDPGGEVICGCGATSRLDALDYRPPAAYGRWAVVIADAADGQITDAGGETVRSFLGEVRVIGRRVVR